MNIKRFLKTYRFQLIVFFLLASPILFLIKDNSLKVLTLELFLIGWLLLSIKTKNIILSCILYILVTLPFNLTYQLPLHVLFFNTDPYVNGMHTNYLVPTLSILDIGLGLFLASYIYEYGFNHIKVILNKYKWYLLFFAGFLVLQNILKLNLVSLIWSFRLLAVIATLLFLIDYFKQQKHKEIYKYILWISVISVLVQGIIGTLQFVNGSSLGLAFLGESQVISGMQGSSFVTLNYEVFLRAYGTFPHPNILGGYLVMNLLLGIYLLPKVKGFYKVLTFILIGLSCVFVLFTFSRIAIVLILLISIVTILSLICRKRLYSFAPLLLIERFTNLLSGSDTSWNDRVNLMKSSLTVIKNNFLMGTGLGNFTKAMEGNVPFTVNNVMLIQPVHNVFLLMVSELGIIGTLLYCLLLGKILISNIRKMNILKWLVIICLLVIGCFDHYLWSLPQGIIIEIIFLLFLMV